MVPFAVTTATTAHKTRVSEMRLLPGAVRRFVPKRAAVPGTAMVERTSSWARHSNEDGP